MKINKNSDHQKNTTPILNTITYKGFPFTSELQAFLHSKLVDTHNNPSHNNPEFQSGVMVSAVCEYFEHIGAQVVVDKEKANRQNVRSGKLVNNNTISDEELKRKAVDLILKGCEQQGIILWDGIPTDRSIKNKKELIDSIESSNPRKCLVSLFDWVAMGQWHKLFIKLNHTLE